MIKKRYNDIFRNDNIVFLIEDSNNFTFSDEMGILCVYCDNINLDDVNFDGKDPETIIHVKATAWWNRFKQQISFQSDISKELIAAGCWDWCMLTRKRK